MINASKRNKYDYVKLKDGAINTVAWAVKESFKRTVVFFPTPADFVITWYCPNKRKDKDNITAGQKYIFDGLQEIGLMKNDGWKEIGSVTHRFEIDKSNPRIEIEIREVG
jgi:Holliday junction resolvase RusA-like endonuclease